eukprot:tig00000448_g900.t1
MDMPMMRVGDDEGHSIFAAEKKQQFEAALRERQAALEKEAQKAHGNAHHAHVPQNGVPRAGANPGVGGPRELRPRRSVDHGHAPHSPAGPEWARVEESALFFGANE